MTPLILTRNDETIDSVCFFSEPGLFHRNPDGFQMSSLSGRGPRERQPHARGLGDHQVILVDVTFAVRVTVIYIYIHS
jgi:hypothetical protein